jgi:DNA mismatch repair protein MutS
MRQYNGIKQQVPNALLMFRLGDFYELFFEDAVVAARELEITLTSRNKEKGAAIPMCGVPFHAAEGYIARLIQKGYRVAICDQTEDPKSAKGLVKRELMRVVTPGTAMDATLVRSRENNFLAAVARVGSGNAARSAVAHVDVSTGEFKVTEMEPVEVAGALEQLGAREVLFPTPGARPLHLHGGDDRNRRHPEYRHRAQLHRACSDGLRRNHCRAKPLPVRGDRRPDNAVIAEKVPTRLMRSF